MNEGTKTMTGNIAARSLALIRRLLYKSTAIIAKQNLRELENRLTEQNVEIGNRLLMLEMQSRMLLSRGSYNFDSASPKINHQPVKAESFDLYLEKFKKLHPHLYDAWANANFGANVEEYKNRPQFSCANHSRPDARTFSGFIAPYLSGRVLDVGCGPYAMPNYLENYPVDLISGLDPLEPFEAHPFEFVRGFAEFLPWEDNTFDVVIAATSLDHTIDLKLALSEIRRVLKPGGYLLVWDWFGEQTEPYDPENKSPELIDKYHLFNFSEAWFEDLVTQHFSIAEKFRLLGEIKYVIHYSLQLKRK
ncbi:MAG: class I SAM-dependent methyltransferase [Anaerolineae bacterium]|nr:class I SAM-dependent methyltransferase [Anaerolineae bacterium]